jgi:hypothetical protein
MPTVNDNASDWIYSDKAILSYLNRCVVKVQDQRFAAAAIAESVCFHLINGF